MDEQGSWSEPVFVSYSHEDSEFVLSLASALRDNGIDIWLVDPTGDVSVPLVVHRRDDEAPSWSPDTSPLRAARAPRATIEARPSSDPSRESCAR